MLTTKEQTIQAVVSEVVKVYGVGEEGRLELKKRLKGNNVWIDQAIAIAVRVLLRNSKRDLRDNIRGGPKDSFVLNKARTSFDEEVVKAVRDAVGKFYAWPLMDGTPLGNAEKDKVVATADKYQAQAIGNFRNGNFLRLVAHGMGKGQTVRDVYKEADLEKLMAKAEREAASV